MPDGGILCSFAPPALLQTNKLLRHEAAPVFYGQNHFQITIKRLPQDDEVCTAGRSLASVDMWVWRRFLHMWDDFNCFGANCLRHVRHLDLIYGLEMDEICPEREGLHRRLGFRLSSHPFEEDCYRVPVKDDGEFDQGPEEDTDLFAVCEVHRGAVKWHSPRDVKFHLFHKMCELGKVSYRIKGSPEGVRHWLPEDGDLHPGVFGSGRRHGERRQNWWLIRDLYTGTDAMWDVYPLKRLAYMLWRCARDCPLASQNIDLVCEDLDFWVDKIGHRTRYEPVDFNDSDDGDD